MLSRASQLIFFILSKHHFAVVRNRRHAFAQQSIVKIRERIVFAAGFLVIFAKFQDLQFAETVTKIERIERSSLGLIARRRGLGVCVVDKELRRLIKIHLAGVKIDGRDESTEPKQSLPMLTES